jgi:hypothetical protein
MTKKKMRLDEIQRLYDSSESEKQRERDKIESEYPELKEQRLIKEKKARQIELLHDLIYVNPTSALAAIDRTPIDMLNAHSSVGFTFLHKAIFEQASDIVVKALRLGVDPTICVSDKNVTYVGINAFELARIRCDMTRDDADRLKAQQICKHLLIYEHPSTSTNVSVSSV